ncbi:unnamed protein product [Clonostachys rosea]|uniref:Xylanolytic transcriptional activator regulatory domain-containing protein n=1 Tax=Bionectria ochroleuca TaxID=29856 RepID=A0ABY6UQK0_BIOOC|nr:unnamed protein product [Clonostachys rosea]
MTKVSERKHKQRPVSKEYVSLLENRVAWLESTLQRLKRASAAERESILSESSFGDHLSKTPCDLLPQDPIQPVRLWMPNLRTDSEGALIYHGPTSIYQAGQVSASEIQHPLSLLTGVHSSEVSEHFGLREDLITSGLHHFFKWQYPHFMFVYREAFLRDYYSNYYGGKYWSQPLLYAICALGTLMISEVPVPDTDESTISDRFFAAAESLLMVFGIEKPCVTTLQAFLCLSFYELGRGNLSKAWTFSGQCFRTEPFPLIKY